MAEPLLTAADAPAFEVLNADGAAPLVLLCDHASARVPVRLGDLGLAAERFGQHIAVDLGAGEVTRGLSRRLGTPAVLAGYSRLAIDCNRWIGDPRSILAVSDHVTVPGNCDLDDGERRRRVVELFWPYHAAVHETIERAIRRNRPVAVVAIHSFTPTLDGHARPWHVGTFWHQDRQLAGPVVERLRESAGLNVGDNEPYSGQSGSFTTDYHGWSAGLPHLGVEIRQDQVADRRGIDRMADLLADALTFALGAVAIRPTVPAGQRAAR